MKKLIGIILGIQLASVLSLAQTRNAYQVSNDGKTVLAESPIQAVRVCFEKNFIQYTPNGTEDIYDQVKGCGFSVEKCPETYQISETEIGVEYQSPVEKIGFCMDLDTSRMNTNKVSVSLIPAAKYTKTRPVIKSVNF